MKKIKLGNTKEEITVIGIGTWKYGNDYKKEIEALQHGFERGIKLVDTAEMYHSEDIVGKALYKSKDVFVATKVSPQNFRYDNVIKACNESLRKLNIKRIDLYQLHWPNVNVSIKETMSAMEKLVEDEKIRHIGVSNFSIKELEEAKGAMKSNRIVSNQVEYSIFVRNIEQDILDYCKNEKITIIAYSPLCRGALFDEKYKAVKDKLDEIGRKYKRDAPQIALNYLISKGTIAIPKASSKKHIDSIIDSANFELTGEEMNYLDDFLLNFQIDPLSARMPGFVKSTLSTWSSLFSFRERIRRNMKI